MSSPSTPVAPTTTAAPRHGWTEMFRRWRHGSFVPGRGGRFRALWLLSAVLNVAVLGLGVYLIGFSRPSVAPPADRRIAALADGLSPARAAARANAAAAYSVTRPGPATSPARAALDAWLADRRG